MRYGSQRKSFRKNMIGETKMNKAYKLLTAQEARRDARKTFIVDAVGWALLSLGTAVIALIVYTMAVVVLGGVL
jgi:predicted anti-sigma-YlaC factor YlaD